MAKRKYKKNNQPPSLKTLLSAAIATVVVAVASILSVDIPGVDLGWDNVFEAVDNFLIAPEARPTVAMADGELAVSIIDVGQGDSILIQAPEKNVLIDAGENDKGDEVVDFLQKNGVDKLDIVICTHLHSDHVGGTDYVLDNVETDLVILPDIKDSMIPSTKTVKSLFESIDNSGIEAAFSSPFDAYELGGGAVLTILGPLQHYDDTNNTSVITRLDFGDTSFLFTGDAERDAEEDLLAECKSYLDVDIYKAGHHGSSTSSTKEFFSAVSPQYVAISCGLNNSYGHPHKEILSLLKDNNIIYNRTDIDGSITYLTDGTEVEVITEK